MFCPPPLASSGRQCNPASLPTAAALCLTRQADKRHCALTGSRSAAAGWGGWEGLRLEGSRPAEAALPTTAFQKTFPAGSLLAYPRQPFYCTRHANTKRCIPTAAVALQEAGRAGKLGGPCSWKAAGRRRLLCPPPLPARGEATTPDGLSMAGENIQMPGNLGRAAVSEGSGTPLAWVGRNGRRPWKAAAGGGQASWQPLRLLSQEPGSSTPTPRLFLLLSASFDAQLLQRRIRQPTHRLAIKRSFKQAASNLAPLAWGSTGLHTATPIKSSRCSSGPKSTTNSSSTGSSRGTPGLCTWSRIRCATSVRSCACRQAGRQHNTW